MSTPQTNDASPITSVETEEEIRQLINTLVTHLPRDQMSVQIPWTCATLVKTVFFQRSSYKTIKLPIDRGSIVVGYNIFYKPNEHRILGAGDAYLTTLY